jgi:histidinol-phosphate phosphatase family protein
MKAVFIDRDGTIGGGNDVTLPKEFKLFSFSKAAFKLLKENGYLLIAFTNQPDISDGKVSVYDFETELSSFGFDDVCICPHRPSDYCPCRKPSPYMIHRAAEKYQLNLAECFVIGDRWSDMLAGIQAGAKSVLVKTGAGMDSLGADCNKWDFTKASYLAENLLDAAQWIICHKTDSR